MRFLAISVLLIISSCGLKTTEGLRSTELKSVKVENPYFSNLETDYVYKAKIDIYGKYFGGILVIKKIDEKTHRVVFTTEFGSKIFDFLYEGDTFTKIFIMEDLDKKLVVNTLRKDFRLLTSEKIAINRQFDSNEGGVYVEDLGKRSNFYFFKANKLEKIVQSSKHKEKFEIVFTTINDSIANHVLIDHHNIKLNIDLSYFKNN